MIRVNDLVKFIEGLYPDETGAQYRVLEINGDRAIIQLENTDMSIKPQSLAILAELEPFKSVPDKEKAE